MEIARDMCYFAVLGSPRSSSPILPSKELYGNCITGVDSGR